jgi:Tol biopolymer transport system component
MPALGGAPRRIVAKGNFPSWTPDGTGILYVHGTFRSPHIAVVPATGGESRDIPIEEPDAFRYFYPRLSVDGRWLLFQNSRQVKVVDAKGGRPRLLAEGQHASWGPASKSILFSSETPGKSQTIWTAPFSLERGELDGPLRPLTFGRGADVGAAASADGSTIAFSAVTETLNLEEYPFDSEAGRVTGAGRVLTSGNNRIGFFDPSPNGESVAFVADRGSGPHLWRVDAPAPPFELTRDPAYRENLPAWSPDGREIVFARPGRGEAVPAGLWVMNADGTSPRHVADGPGFGISAWLPEGKSVLAISDDRIVRIDLASGSAVPIEGALTGTWFVVDRSGSWIAMQTDRGGTITIATLPVAGGKPRIVVDETFGGHHPFFSPSGNWLYFQPNHKNIFRVPGPAQNWKNASPQQVTDFSGVDLYLEDPKLSRDGKKLFFTRGRRVGDIMILHLSKGVEQRTAS